MIETAVWVLSVILAYLILIFVGVQFADKKSITYFYCRRNWIAIDQTVNAMLFGNEDVTISGRAGRKAEVGARFWAALARLINALFRDPNHCRDSIEHDERQYYEHYTTKFLLIYAASCAFSVAVLTIIIRHAFF